MNTNLIKNVISLGIVQIVSYISPLLLFPYLSRTLGVDGFGIVMIAMSICSLGFIVTDYGFNLSATYWLARNKTKKKYVSHYIGAIFTVKLLLAFLVSFFIYIYHACGLTELSHRKDILSIVSLICVVQAFQSAWFFQGIEKMKQVAFYSVISKLLYVILVLLFVDKSGEEIKVLYCLLISNFVGSIVSLLGIYREGYYIYRPSLNLILRILKRGFSFFISRLSVSAYTAASTFIIGNFCGNGQAAIFSAAEKLYQAGVGVTSPVSQALYPYLARTKDRILLYRFIILCIPVLFIVGGGCFYFSSQIINLIYGRGFEAASDILKVFILCSFVNFISVSFGYPAFASIGKLNVANYSVILGGGVQIIAILIVFLFSSISAKNIAYCVLFTESFVLVFRVSFFLILSHRRYCRGGV
ncbi:oligosaccharide flippase family protein [Escherichia albertii]|uniref:oligosaccharide flippase family protein n=1 Tax=Escherichia albertii TaxID=208962 RepID=UPI001A130F34|nr:oligosaccharide flippase family protein [Escherichia albertii]MCU7296689.1 oligosaccharide flippase family protein [Escherichia albertii]MCZ8924710.1 oligosaccharide flippase family protein [Escherichia albertii]MCZ9154223.1 oligosaccharide flippase family protein [Escherichia albertii]MCZ9163879.1 oligosaccharide flippase family protein [Escherichia albertii]MCZ9220874.1 oligosaccharide flippase family protein [Escherichia albertii]